MNPENKKELVFNLPQLLTVIAPQRKKFLEWGRGTGKSTIIAYQIKEIAHQMPRSSSLIVGETYQQILTRTLPSTIASLERMGFYKDLHFFIGKTAPKSWKWQEPYEPTGKYDYYMHWYTGAGFHLVSQDRPGSGRGLNTDAVIGDEMTLLDFEKLFNDALATKRGNIDRFGKCPLHQSEFFSGTVPMTNKGKWVYKMEEEAKKSPNEIFYIRASAEENRINLGENFFKDNKRRLPTLIYNAEILNIRPDKVEGGFYALLNEEKHTYSAYNYTYLDSLDYNVTEAHLNSKQDNDVNHDQPLELAMDYGAHINVAVVGQESMNTFRFLNTLYVKHPFRINDLINNLCDYYSTHRNKTIYYYYDHTAVFTDASRTITYADEVINILRSRGWTVIPVYIGQAPSHHKRYLFWGIALSDDKRMPHIQINKHNSKVLLISMLHAGVKEGRNGFEKDKRPERNTNIDQSETTHPSDAADTLLYGKYSTTLTTHTDYIDLFVG